MKKKFVTVAVLSNLSRFKNRESFYVVRFLRKKKKILKIIVNKNSE